MFLATAVLCAAMGWGDRLFEIPTGSVLDRGVLRCEYGSPLSKPGKHTDWLEFGLTSNLEISAVHETIPGLHSREGINAQYNLMPPITEDFPGISIGIKDIFDRTELRRSYYAAFSWSTPLENGAAGSKYFVLHAGVGGGGIKGAFVGFDFPLTENFSLQAEHDSLRITAGLQWNPIRDAGLRLYMQGDRIVWGLTFSRRL
jgi:hypothetical protein